MNSIAYAGVHLVSSSRRFHMVRKVMTIMMIGGGLLMAACNTVRGAGEDVQSVANCTENAINNGQC
jgi:predicted small secreted protein